MRVCPSAAHLNLLDPVTRSWGSKSQSNRNRPEPLERGRSLRPCLRISFSPSFHLTSFAFPHGSCQALPNGSLANLRSLLKGKDKEEKMAHFVEILAEVTRSPPRLTLPCRLVFPVSLSFLCDVCRPNKAGHVRTHKHARLSQATKVSDLEHLRNHYQTIDE